MPTHKRAAHEPGRRRATFLLTPLLRLWQRLLNRWRRRIGWERMDTRDLPRLVGHDTQTLPALKAQVNGDGASTNAEKE
jgi:hypothetical protein